MNELAPHIDFNQATGDFSYTVNGVLVVVKASEAAPWAKVNVTHGLQEGAARTNELRKNIYMSAYQDGLDKLGRFETNFPDPVIPQMAAETVGDEVVDVPWGPPLAALPTLPPHGPTPVKHGKVGPFGTE